MKKKQEPVILDPKVAPPPTVPVQSWAEARANYKRGPVLCEPSLAAAYFREYIGGAYSDAKRPMIPIQKDRSFQSKATGCSNRKRPKLSDSFGGARTA